MWLHSDSIILRYMLISHGEGYEDCRLSGFDAVYSVRNYKYLDNTHCWGSKASETSAHVYQTTWRYILQNILNGWGGGLYFILHVMED